MKKNLEKSMLEPNKPAEYDNLNYLDYFINNIFSSFQNRNPQISFVRTLYVLMSRRKVTLRLNNNVVEQAKNAGVNFSS